jgi:hypothetical protein
MIIYLWEEEKPQKSREQRRYEFVRECLEGYRKYLEDKRNGVARDLESYLYDPRGFEDKIYDELGIYDDY